MNISARDLSTLRIGAILNRNSGQCDDAAEERMRAILETAGARPVEIACVDGAALTSELERMLSQVLDVLIVLGGDGTIRTAAEVCGTKNIALMPLPGGTMNMLPKALYGERSWEDALAATLANPMVRRIGGGQVEGHRFFCAAIFGTASLWAGVREAARAGRFNRLLARARLAFRRHFSSRLGYRFGESMTGRAEAIAVLCPLVSKSLASETHALEAAALDPGGGFEAFRLALNAVFSDWRNDQSVETTATATLEIASLHGIPAILDGEIVELSRRVEVSFVANAFRALVPKV